MSTEVYGTLGSGVSQWIACFGSKRRASSAVVAVMAGRPVGRHRYFAVVRRRGQRAALGRSTMVSKNRVALVTGAGRNLGREIALALGRSGADVAVNVRRDLAGAEAVCAELRALGVRALPVVADVAAEDEVAAMVLAVVEQLGPVTVLVNNAGPRAESPLENLTRAAWDEVVDAVLTGSFHTCRAAAPGMRELGWAAS